jgi:hypothetical protein
VVWPRQLYSNTGEQEQHELRALTEAKAEDSVLMQKLAEGRERNGDGFILEVWTPAGSLMHAGLHTSFPNAESLTFKYYR